MSNPIIYSGKGQAGNLLDPNNWVGGIVPGSNDFAEITMNVGGPIGGTHTYNNIMVLGSEQITFTGTLDTTGALNQCFGLYVCVGAGATFAPGAVLNDPGVLVVGQGATGTFLAEGSGTSHSIINSAVGKLGNLAHGVGTATIDDATWNNSGEVVIGYLGKGTLDVTDGGVVHIGTDAWLACYAGTSGTMNISSGGSVSVGGFLDIGVARGLTSNASASVGTGSSLTVNGALTVDTGSHLTLAGGTVTGGITSDCVMISSGGVVSGFGTLNSPEPNLNRMVDNGTILATGGTLNVTAGLLGAGTIQIAANSTAMMTGAYINLPSIAFIGPDATLGLAHGSSIAATLSGFGLSDMITMANITTASFTASTGMLALRQNNAFVENLHMAGNFTGDTFAVHQVGALSTITLQHS